MTTFKEAFRAARKKYGANGTFTWNGKEYNTKYKEEVSAPAKKPKTVRPKRNPNRAPMVMSTAPAGPTRPATSGNLVVKRKK